MPLFTTLKDEQLEAARKDVVPGEVVCPSCKAPLQITGATLSTWNPALGLEGHRCPACGHVLVRRRGGPDRL